jgi:hypothetical protein
VNDASGRAITRGFPQAWTGKKQPLPRSTTGIDGRGSGEFANAEQNLAGVDSDIVFAGID